MKLQKYRFYCIMYLLNILNHINAFFHYLYSYLILKVTFVQNSQKHIEYEDFELLLKYYYYMQLHLQNQGNYIRLLYFVYRSPTRLQLLFPLKVSKVVPSTISFKTLLFSPLITSHMNLRLIILNSAVMVYISALSTQINATLLVKLTNLTDIYKSQIQYQGLLKFSLNCNKCSLFYPFNYRTNP